MSFLKTLKEPFPYYGSPLNHLRVAGFFSVFIFLFLLLFKPFDLGKYDTARIIWVTAGYGIISFVFIFLTNALLPILFPSFFSEKTWTTGKQIGLMIFVIFMVGLGNYLLSPLLVDSRLNLYYLFWFQGITLSVAVLPVSLYFLIRQNLLLKKFSKEADQIEQRLRNKLEEETVTTEVSPKQNLKMVLIGENQGERLEIYPDDLHLINSASNYIKIYHEKGEKLIYTILRCTLKKAEEQVLQYSNFFKCHRAYIINLDKVVHVEGNAQGYKLRISHHEELIPVSRNLNTEFSDKLFSSNHAINHTS